MSHRRSRSVIDVTSTVGSVRLAQTADPETIHLLSLYIDLASAEVMESGDYYPLLLYNQTNYVSHLATALATGREPPAWTSAPPHWGRCTTWVARGVRLVHGRLVPVR